MAKITKATFKSFVKKNRDKLLILFDGMSDCVMPTGDGGFHKVVDADYVHENNLGIRGVWIVGGSHNYFTDYVDANGLIGIDVYNCCGHFIVAVKDPETAALKILSKK